MNKKKTVVCMLLSFLVAGIGLFHSSTNLYAAQGDSNIIVVLDPGHDAKHGGSTHYGLLEHEVVFKIASYCKEELEKYQGVTVYLTRESNKCPQSVPGNSVTCNEGRVDFAQSVGADVYISFHLDAVESGNAKGASIYYPNSNYNAQIGAEGKELATNILAELMNLGISKNGEGIKIRNSKDGTTYPDGSLADYLAVIKGAKLRGFPAVLIEHMFLTNKEEVTTFLDTDEKLQKIGIADATGIANYLGLTKNAVQQAEDGNWYYYVDGVIDTSYTGIGRNAAGAWFVRNGMVDFSVNNVAYCGDAWYYFQNGQVMHVNTVAPTLDGSWWCIKDGKVDFSYTGLAQNESGWWYIENGAVNFGYTGLAYYNGNWYYVEKGGLNWNYTGLTNYYGTWYYVENGVLNWDYTGLTNYYGTWYYVENGVLNWNYTGLVLHYGSWYYVANGVLDWNFTGTVYQYGSWWYVENGIMIGAA